MYKNYLVVKKPYMFKSTPHWGEEKSSEETSSASVLLVMVIPDTCFYFRQESLIEYDREKMRVWGQWHLQILPNNREDASDQPVSPSCACYLISFIFLINFTGMKVCGDVGWGLGSHQPCTYSERQWTASNSNVTLNCPRLNTNESDNGQQAFC